MLHSNPGDYAWGQGGLDAVITQVSRDAAAPTLAFVCPPSSSSSSSTLSVFSLLPQLLGQFENTGPPPAEKEKISSLPTVIVSQEQAGE